MHGELKVSLQTADVTGIAMTAAAGTLAATGDANLTLNTLNVAQATLR